MGARGCCHQGCNCSFSGGDGVAVLTGSGTQNDPLQVFVPPLASGDTAGGVDITTFNDGETQEITAAINEESRLDMLGDVTAPTPSAGLVLAWDGLAWVPVAPTTAPTGAVVHDDSLTGDGSGAHPMGVTYDPDGFVELRTLGVGLGDDGINQLNRKFDDDAARSSADPAPDLNTLSMLGDNPGQPYYFDGTDWQPLLKLRSVVGTALMELSGPYSGGPIDIVAKQIDDTTDADGMFMLLDSTDLVVASGVLSVSFVPLTYSDAPYLVTFDYGVNELHGIGWAIDGSGVLVSSPVAGTLTAYLY